MAKVPLRLYNREIESLIDHGQVEEAIAHCKHLLLSFPKHIETYRLLAKAFLESQQYGEASDVFQRVLSAVPDDFISHVGMSIIREDEGNLDGAVWYMERAFEVQPSNAMVQEELRRLYQRRDGTELPRIRLTRGALARMYARGDLYQQAIAEIRGTLVSEPIRPDLQVLLARMCFQAGQRIESTEICGELLSKFPFCFEANRLLSQILPNTSRSEDAKIYLQRVYALDPYTAFLTPTILSSKDVPENAIMVEHFEYKAGVKTENEQPGWASSLGLVMPADKVSTEQLPEWLNGIEKPQSSATIDEPEQKEDETSATISPDSEENRLPDWMKSAGWVESQEGTSEARDENPVFKEESQELTSSDDELAPADIPDWLKEIAPTARANDQGTNKTSPPDWIVDDSTPDWLKNIQPAQEIPEITKDATISETPALSMDELPDWLKSEVVAPVQLSPTQSPLDSSTQQADEQPLAELPDWLQDLKSNASVSSDSAAQTESSPTSEVLPLSTADSGAVQSSAMGALPDWLSALANSSETQETSSPESLPTPEVSTAVSEGNQELLARPASNNQDWLQELGKEDSKTVSALDENLPAEETIKEALQISHELPTETPVASSAAAVTQPPSASFPSMDDQDAALAWLEGLAAKHGAEEETLYVKPENRTEAPPTWVQQASNDVAETQANPASNDVPSAAAIPEPQPVAGTSEPQPTAVTPENQPVAAISEPQPAAVTPETQPIAAIPEPQPVAATAEAQPVEMTAAPVQPLDETEAALAWLEGLAAKQGAEEETLYVKPEDRTPLPPDWVQKAAEIQIIKPSLPPEPEQVAEVSQQLGEPLTPTEPAVLEGQVLEPESEGSEAPSPITSPAEELPQWLQDLQANRETPPQPVQEPEIQAQPSEQPVITDEQVAPPQVEKHSVSQQPPAEELPKWLQEPGVAQEIKDETVPEVNNSVAVPDQAGLSEETLAAGQPEEQLPDWLREFEEPANTGPALPDAVDLTSTWQETINEPEPLNLQPGPAGTPSKTPEMMVPPPSAPETAPIQAQEKGQIDSSKLLLESQAAFTSGKVDLAVQGYNQLVEQGLLIDETIHDLRDALYRFPVDISIWQVLGEAYVRSNRLQDALDAFTKAEELLR